MLLAILLLSCLSFSAPEQSTAAATPVYSSNPCAEKELWHHARCLATTEKKEPGYELT